MKRILTEHNMKRILTAFIALLLLATAFSSCNKNSGKNPEETKPKDVDEPYDISPSLEGKKFGNKELNIWQFTNASNAAEYFYDMNGSMTDGDMISSEIYKRNDFVETKIGVCLNFTDTGVYSSDAGQTVRVLLLADSTDFDAYELIQWNGMPLVIEGLLKDLTDAPYLDFSQAWWLEEYQNATKYCGKQYVLAGDVSIDMISCASAVFVNKSLLTDYYGSDAYEELRQKVLDGDWDMDQMITYSTGLYKDLNGNESVDLDDQFGFLTNYSNNIDAWFFGGGGTVFGNGEDGQYVLNFNTEHNIDLMDKIEKICFETSPKDFGNTVNGTVIDGNLTRAVVEKFGTGENTLFCTGFLYTARNFTNMTAQFGVLPFPKYDSETQDRYYSVMHNIVTMFALPYNCENVDATCAAMEALACVGHQSVVPTYYETVLKIRYLDDLDDAALIDLIYNSRMTDVGYVYENKAAEVPRYVIMYRMKLSWYAEHYYDLMKSGLDKVNGIKQEET